MAHRGMSGEGLLGNSSVGMVMELENRTDAQVAHKEMGPENETHAPVAHRVMGPGIGVPA